MNGRGRFLELLVLGCCSLVLTQAILSMILGLEPGTPSVEGNPVWKLILIVCYLSVAVILVPYYRETLLVIRRNG